jgi:NAD(P)-dependent dehydrogenase (short-subunit alcohol dehydrogenase family)
MNPASRNAVALVTGGTTGIGLVACQQLAGMGIDVIFTSRSTAKGNEAVAQIERYAAAAGNTTNKIGKVRFVVMELSDLTSVSKACDEILQKEPCLNYLILNAGVMGNSAKSIMTKSIDGIESTVAVNHVAGYYIAHKLLPLLEATVKDSPLDDNKNNSYNAPMITFVSSGLHNIHSSTGAAKKVGPVVDDNVVRFCSQQGISGVDATAARESSEYSLSFHALWMYKYSKLLNVLTATAMSEKLGQRNSLVQCNSMEPGFIPQSDLVRAAKERMGRFIFGIAMYLLYFRPIHLIVSYIIGLPLRTLKEGAASEVFAATKGRTGKYYSLDREDPPTPLAEEKDVVEGFYQATFDLLQTKGFEIKIL